MRQTKQTNKQTNKQKQTPKNKKTQKQTLQIKRIRGNTHKTNT